MLQNTRFWRYNNFINEYLELNVVKRNITEQDLAMALAESYRDLVGKTTTGSVRRKREVNATVQDGTVSYTVKVIRTKCICLAEVCFLIDN